MRSRGYDTFVDPYAYKGTATLKNKARLRDSIKLEEFELLMTAIRANEPLPLGAFDPLHYRSVHHHLFQDVYRWAGKYRTVRTSKDGNHFCYPEYIEHEMNRLFGTLDRTLDASSAPQFVDEAARFLAELNAIHPFREGNGRAQLAFLSMVSNHVSFPLDFSAVRPDAFMSAMIKSFGGQLGLLRAELRHLL
jgi:cell filamentation protein